MGLLQQVGRWGRRLGVTGMAALVAVILAAGTVAGIARAESPPPEAVVRTLYDALLAVMKNGPALGFDGRYTRLQPAVSQALHLPFMTRVAVGLSWRTLKPDEQNQLIDRFSSFSVANYARNFNAFEGESFVVEGSRAMADGRVVVDSRIVPANGAPVEIDYLLENFDGQWRVIDVFLSGTISELAVRRSEFAAVLRRDGFQGLVTLLDQKIRELKAG